MSVIVAYSAAATGSPLNKAKPPKHSLNETGKFIILRLTVSPKIFPHCLTVADCNPCGASQIHIGVIKSGSSGRELTQEIMIIVTIVRTVSIAKNSPYRIERYRECYIVFANTISPLWLLPSDGKPVSSVCIIKTNSGQTFPEKIIGYCICTT